MTAHVDTGMLQDECEPGSRTLIDKLPGLDRVKVLVVDDDSSAREAIAAVLTQCGAVTTGVASAADALIAIERIRPDVPVSDIGMPEESGYELISNVRQLGAD